MNAHARIALASPILVFGIFFFGLALLVRLRLTTFEASCIVLGLALLAQLSSAWWISEQVPSFRRCLDLCFGGILTILAGWLWQRLAYLHFIPSDDLAYGFFLTEKGAHPRLMIMHLPSWTITTLLGLEGAAACAIAWRDGARWSLASSIAWWFVAYFIFSFTGEYLSWQGEATLFI